MTTYAELIKLIPLSHHVYTTFIPSMPGIRFESGQCMAYHLLISSCKWLATEQSQYRCLIWLLFKQQACLYRQKPNGTVHFAQTIYLALASELQSHELLIYCRFIIFGELSKAWNTCISRRQSQLELSVILQEAQTRQRSQRGLLQQRINFLLVSMSSWKLN